MEVCEGWNWTLDEISGNRLSTTKLQETDRCGAMEIVSVSEKIQNKYLECL